MMDLNQHDIEKKSYSDLRIVHWDKQRKRRRGKRAIFSRFYQKIIQKRYRFHIPEGQNVLELGCGEGDLLASLKPSVGVGIDFCLSMIDEAKKRHSGLSFYCQDVHDFSLNERFDYIVISDLLNDIWDVQRLMENVFSHCHADTRIIFNSYSNVWKPVLSFASKLGLANRILQQNWFTVHDIRNILRLEGFEIIKSTSEILFPAPFPLVEPFFNNYLCKITPFRWFDLCNFVIAKKESRLDLDDSPSVSVIVAARNEEGNIKALFERTPSMGKHTELIFVEGGSSDQTYAKIHEEIKNNPNVDASVYQQTGVGKGDAVRLGFSKAKNDILMILDADMTVAPEDLPKFYEALIQGKGEFVNGVRLVYPMHEKAMRFFNILGNKFFSYAFTWILGQPIKDTLCGTKVMTRKNYEKLAANRSYFGDFDPFGDFDLIFGAAKLNLKIVDMPIRYGERVYGDTNIDRWKAGVLLLRMVIFAAKRIKFV